jgi:2'-5' RNA ligase
VARLFSAVVPPEPVLDQLAGALGPIDRPLRAEPRAGWHVTLGFYGDGEDPGTRLAWLQDALSGLAAPRLRLHGRGTFPGVGWVGVQADQTLDRLALAAGAGVGRPHKAHLTIARWRPQEQRAGQAALSTVTGYRSQWWTATEVALMASVRTGAGSRYTVVGRVPLAGM